MKHTELNTNHRFGATLDGFSPKVSAVHFPFPIALRMYSDTDMK